MLLLEDGLVAGSEWLLNDGELHDGDLLLNVFLVGDRELMLLHLHSGVLNPDLLVHKLRIYVL